MIYLKRKIYDMNIQERREMIVQQLNKYSDWESKYREVIDLGKKLESMPDAFKTPTNLVKGCQSQVWMHVETQANGKIKIYGDSDAVIVKGLVALLIFVYSESTPQEILAVPADFIKEIGFEGNLSQSRANGLAAMIKQIKMYATVLSMTQKS